MLALSGIKCLLDKCSSAKPVFDRLGGYEALIALQGSKYHEIYKLALDLLEQHYDAEQMDEDDKEAFL